MSFVTKEWKDRLAEFAGRRKLTNVSTGEETTVDVSRAEGEVSQAGDAFSAANMNDLEQRIKDGFDKVDTNLPIDITSLFSWNNCSMKKATFYPTQNMVEVEMAWKDIANSLQRISDIPTEYQIYSLTEPYMAEEFNLLCEGRTVSFYDVRARFESKTSIYANYSTNVADSGYMKVRWYTVAK